MRNEFNMNMYSKDGKGYFCKLEKSSLIFTFRKKVREKMTRPNMRALQKRAKSFQ